MKALMIVARDSMIGELESLLCDTGINAYSIINKVMGKGKTGEIHELFLDTGYKGYNLMIFAILPPDQIDKAISALKAFHATRAKMTHGEPVPFKLFSFPCEEHL